MAIKFYLFHTNLLVNQRKLFEIPILKICLLHIGRIILCCLIGWSKNLLIVVLFDKIVHQNLIIINNFSSMEYLGIRFSIIGLRIYFLWELVKNNEMGH
jgi:hypothetical protein